MHELYDITDFSIVAPYTLWMRFDDGKEQTINFEPILRGALYSPLRDESKFNAVRLDKEIKNLVWSNGADFDPETLHNWDQYKTAWTEQAKEWAAS